MATAAEIAKAQALVAAYEAAELAVLSGKSYRIGSRTLEREDLAVILEGKAKAQNDLDRLLLSRPRGAAVMRVIPRDF